MHETKIKSEKYFRAKEPLKDVPSLCEIIILQKRWRRFIVNVTEGKKDGDLCFQELPLEKCLKK